MMRTLHALPLAPAVALGLATSPANGEHDGAAFGPSPSFYVDNAKKPHAAHAKLAYSDGARKVVP